MSWVMLPVLSGAGGRISLRPGVWVVSPEVPKSEGGTRGTIGPGPSVCPPALFVVLFVFPDWPSPFQAGCLIEQEKSGYVANATWIPFARRTWMGL